MSQIQQRISFWDFLLQPERSAASLEHRDSLLGIRRGFMNQESPWTVYRTRFVVRARQLTQALVFTDALGREHSGRPGDYLVESSQGFRRITPRELFEDIYVPLETPGRTPTAASPMETRSHGALGDLPIKPDSLPARRGLAWSGTARPPFEPIRLVARGS